MRAPHEGAGDDGGSVRRHAALGEPRQLEEEDVPGLPELSAQVPHRVCECGGRRAVDRDELLDELRVTGRDRPGHGATPVVADDDRPLAAEGLDEPGHVADEGADVVRALQVGVPVAPHVGCDRAVAGRAERGSWWRHRARELGEAVEEHDEGPSSGPDARAWKRMPLATRSRSSIAGSSGRMWANRHTTAPMDIWRPVARRSSRRGVTANAVLLAEHEQESREYLERQLREDGFVVFEAAWTARRSTLPSACSSTS